MLQQSQGEYVWLAINSSAELIPVTSRCTKTKENMKTHLITAPLVQISHTNWNKGEKTERKVGARTRF